MYIVHGILFPGGLFSFVHKYEREGKLLKMSEKQSVFLPEGSFEVKAIPQAEIADIYTSKELIADNGLDSFYGKYLKEFGKFDGNLSTDTYQIGFGIKFHFII